MSRPWFKFYTRDFRDGVRRMSPETTGVYVLVLSLIYERADGKLADIDADICADLSLDRRLWKRVRAELIERGKLTASDGFLVNARAAIEVRRAEDVAQLRQKSGRSGGLQKASNAANALKTNGSPLASATNLLDTETQRHRNTEPRDKSLGSARARAKPKRVSSEATLPAAPTAAMVRDAEARGFVNGSLTTEFAKWRDYHLAHGTAIADHDASFRTWIGNAIRFRTPDRPSNGAPFRPRIYPNPYQG